jgi:hypothetical protein
MFSLNKIVLFHESQNVHLNPWKMSGEARKIWRKKIINIERKSEFD